MQHKQIISQTTAVLYQQPTRAEQRVSKLSIAIVNIKEFLIFTVLAVMFWLVLNYFSTLFM